jgi:NAD+ diphosphatase
MREAASSAPLFYRGDDAKLAALTADDRARFYVIGGELAVLKKRGEEFDPLFSPAEAARSAPRATTVFLGLMDEAPRFGAGLDPAAVEPLKARDDLKLIDLRTIAVQARRAEHVPPLAEAKAVLGWHARHRFCPNCGAVTRARRKAAGGAIVPLQGRAFSAHRSGRHHAGDRRRALRARPLAALSRKPCGRVSPVSRTRRIDRGGGAARGAEEVGLTCARVKYFSSQPWPFPSSLMIGCHAEALTEKIVIDRSEIEEARWFDRDELKLMLTRKHPQA